MADFILLIAAVLIAFRDRVRRGAPHARPHGGRSRRRDRHVDRRFHFVIALYAHVSGRFIYLDVALVYGVLSFLAVLAVARYLERGL